MSKISSLPLNTTKTIPAFGLGTFLSQPGEVRAAVEAAIRMGYRHLDCAHIYGNEAEVGEALQTCFREGVVKREEMFITSKLWSYDFYQESVLPACRLTLKNLQLDYLDLYLIHVPQAMHRDSKVKGRSPEYLLGYSADNIAKVWEGMEELVNKGLCQAIGVSNFTITKIERLLQTAKVKPAVNQVEFHPYLQQPKLKQYLDSKGIVMEAYSPLGAPARPQFITTDGDPVVMEDPVVKKIAAKHNVSPAQVCIAFALQCGMVVIPKSVNPVRLEENLEGTEMTLTQEDMARLQGIDKDYRLFSMHHLLNDFNYNEAWDVEADRQFVVNQ